MNYEDYKNLSESKKELLLTKFKEYETSKDLNLKKEMDEAISVIFNIKKEAYIKT